MNLIHLACSALLVSLMCGCMPREHAVDIATPAVGQSVTVGPGDMLFVREVVRGKDNGTSNNIFLGDGENNKWTLAVIGASKSVLKLQYNEYDKPSTSSYFEADGPWLIRPSFSQALELSLDSKEITYRGIVFRIDSQSTNSVVVTRIK